MAFDDLDPEHVAARLTSQWCGRSTSYVAETASTNDDARAASLRGAGHGHVVVADRQTSGRGSRGRTWLSPAGTDLYLSIVVHSDIALSALAPITLAIGVAVAEVVDNLLGASGRAQVKWPNDVWVDGHKVAGILVESSTLGTQALPLVVGLGFNVNRRDFPADLDTPGTSLALLTGHTFERAEVLAQLLSRIETWIDRHATQGVEDIVHAITPRLALLGVEARCDDVIGRVQGVDARGALVFDTATGPRAVMAGTLRALR